MVDHPLIPWTAAGWTRCPCTAGRAARRTRRCRRARGRRGHDGGVIDLGTLPGDSTGHGGPRFWTSRTAAPRGSRA
ncbi:hypothetical protein QJS66_01365 [Kocuria rhizophila]|nr:hypothetical protein QJS66_01365 [Kocuria rhizophila]